MILLRCGIVDNVGGFMKYDGWYHHLIPSCELDDWLGDSEDYVEPLDGEYPSRKMAEDMKEFIDAIISIPD